MMDKYDSAIDLIREAKQEKERYYRMCQEVAALDLSAEDYWDQRQRIENNYSPIPNMATVDRRINKACRLLQGG